MIICRHKHSYLQSTYLAHYLHTLYNRHTYQILLNKINATLIEIIMILENNL